MKRITPPLIALILGTCLAQAESLPSKMRSGPIVLELASEQNAIVPGEPFTVGLHIIHDKGYHTYWKYPGVVGVPTGFDWQLPDGWKAGAVQWPQPILSKMADLTIYGYEDDTTLLVQLTPPADLEPDTTVNLPVELSWMACAQSCHPGFTSMSLSLPVAEKTTTNRIWKKRFDAARSTFARPSDAWSFSGTGSATSLTLIATPKAGANAEIKEFYFFDDLEQVDSRERQQVTRKDGKIYITMPRVEWQEKNLPTRMHGILQSKESWVKGEVLNNLSVDVDL